MEPDSPAVAQDRSAHFFNFFCGHFPELAGAQLGIAEFLDQGGFHLAVFPAGQHFGENVL